MSDEAKAAAVPENDSTMDDNPVDEDALLRDDEKEEEGKAAPEEKISGITGTVFKNRRVGIYVNFQHEGKEHTAGLNPGLAYVNGSRLLIDLCPTDYEIMLLLPRNTKVTFDAVSSRAVPVSPEGPPAGGKKTCCWSITFLSVGQKPMANVEENFQKRYESISSSVFSTASATSSEPVKTPEFEDGEPWFIKTVALPTEASGRALPHPDDAEFVGEEGVVTELLPPTGGVIEMSGSGKKIFFHRGRVFLDGKHLSPVGDLKEDLPVGTKVKVDYVENEIGDKGGVYFDDCAATLVALLVYSGNRPEVPEIIFKEAARQESDKFYIARIVEFDPPGETGVEGGVAEIVQASEYNHQIKNWLKSRLETKDGGKIKRVRFHRSKLFHFGCHLGKTDLRYLFSCNAFGMGYLFCRVKDVDGAAPDAEIKHEMEVGWKCSQGATVLGAPHNFLFRPITKEGALLHPTLQWLSVKRLMNMKVLAKDSLDLGTYLDIVEGNVPPAPLLCDGVIKPEEKSQWELARVYDLMHMNSPHNRKGGEKYATTISCGLVVIESGEHAGKQAFFYRKDVSIYGFRLDNAHLVGLLEQNDPVYVKLEVSNKKEHHVKLKCTEMFFGLPAADPETGVQSLEDLPKAFRHKFLLYLESRGLAVKKFLEMLKTPGSDRPLIPFRREEMRGTVVMLERDDKPKLGATGGFIKVDKGPLQGQFVSFFRRHVWALGYNLGKADLTHIFIEGQKVSLEAIEIPKGKEVKKSVRAALDVLGGECSHRATLVWTSKFRPDHGKSVNRNAAVDGWLGKRGLQFEDVEKLVGGNLPAVPAALATKRKSNMLKGGQEKKAFEEGAKTTAPDHASAMEKGKAAAVDPSKLPVFRHGKDAERICDMALTVTGPKDKRIHNMIKNDAQAQMAFHMQKALEMAIDAYKESRTSPWARGGVSAAFGDYAGNGAGNVAAWSQRDQAPPQPAPLMGGVLSPWGGGGGGQQGQVGPVVQMTNWGPPTNGSTAAPFRPSGGGNPRNAPGNRAPGGGGWKSGGGMAGKKRGHGGGEANGMKGAKKQKFQKQKFQNRK